MSKVILITGTSTGLGAFAAVKLAELGHTVIATMRNLGKSSHIQTLASQHQASIELLELDVQSTQSVQNCVDQVIAKHGRIDVLINNAGAGFVRTTEQASEEDVAWVMDVNFHGVVRTTKAVLPHMRKARSGHVINISSVGGLVGQPFNEFYCAAKFALEGYVESVATYITPNFNVHFTNVEPGGIQSEFAANVLAQFEQGGGMVEDEYLPILQKYLSGAGTRSEGVYQTVEQVTDVVVDVINSETPPLRTRTSQWSEAFTQLKTQSDPTGQKQVQAVYDAFLK
ncbi:SDR family oxidoreductase [Vibrio sp. SCSIO 43136]|uniref:SDR family oxidoreductase n=1 Tax=Vibrio sp. SCSIO 43136 TaxID=2819101 RepID=UPI002075652A|nr:SDR family oxidoreductase [Vibrio sp. SCSIO 43136]USD67607.1 SDR family oxidoreductase [Vibrio sp. SCSIO 43136]